MILPSVNVLKAVLRKLYLQPGIMPFLINHIKDKVPKMTRDERHCLVMWDEMSLKAHLHYDASKDEITGFEDWGNVRTSHIADHALVFMIKGIFGNCKLPLTYNFCKSSTKNEQLAHCIKDVLKALGTIGLIVVATVCDQGSPNISAVNTLKRETRESKLRAGLEYGACVYFNII